MFGISTDGSCNTFATIDYGLNLENGIISARLNGYQNGSALGSSVDVAALDGTDGNVFIELERVGTAVKAYITLYSGSPPSPGGGGRTLLFTFTNSSTGTLLINVAINGNGNVFDAADFIWESI